MESYESPAGRGQAELEAREGEGAPGSPENSSNPSRLHQMPPRLLEGQAGGHDKAKLQSREATHPRTPWTGLKPGMLVPLTWLPSNLRRAWSSWTLLPGPEASTRCLRWSQTSPTALRTFLGSENLRTPSCVSAGTVTLSHTPTGTTRGDIPRQPQPSSRDPPRLPPGPARPSPALQEGPAPATYRLQEEMGQDSLDFLSPGRGLRSCSRQPADFSGSEWKRCWMRMGRRGCRHRCFGALAVPWRPRERLNLLHASAPSPTPRVSMCQRKGSEIAGSSSRPLERTPRSVCARVRPRAGSAGDSEELSAPEVLNRGRWNPGLKLSI
ncbi:hypothetical protein P7K49_033634 [Saguinus oedipus]|uniref:Uncharacterized protein n=1 Tax=Saguinus oedipus TaxID=9490 RepID=A0ABQ9TU80_SAGOE|nr:hypothetical protein P7K49_033634 [Saguinus oedipus]